jgi:glycosyltransferase involved in cell wall biosynthesis
VPRVVHTFLKYPPAVGGHERHVQDLAEGLKRRGYDVRVVTSDLRVGPVAPAGGGALARLARAGRRLRGVRGEMEGEVLENPAPEVNGVPVVRLPVALPLTRRVELRGFREVLAASRPDVIHAHDIWRDSFEASIDVARDLGVPLLLSPVYHERAGERHLEELRRVAAKVPAEAVVFFNTPWEEERLAAAGIRFARTDLLPPSVDLEELARVPDAPVPGLPADRLVVSFVGRLVPAKGIDVLVSAFAEALRSLRAEGHPSADRLHLAVAGFREGAYDPAEAVARAGIERATTLLPDLPRAGVVNLLRASSIFALPSRCDTFGIVVLEAWATENLVLVSDHWGLPRVVTDGDNGLVCSDAAWPERLAFAIRALSIPEGERLVRRGRETVLEKHGREARIDRYAGHVEAALSSRRASRTDR